ATCPAKACTGASSWPRGRPALPWGLRAGPVARAGHPPAVGVLQCTDYQAGPLEDVNGHIRAPEELSRGAATTDEKAVKPGIFSSQLRAGLITICHPTSQHCGARRRPVPTPEGGAALPGEEGSLGLWPSKPSAQPCGEPSPCVPSPPAPA